MKLRFNRTIRLPRCNLPNRFEFNQASRRQFVACTPVAMSGEKFDVLDAQGNKTGVARPRGEVHALGLYHRAVHTWLYSISTGELCLQKRAECKDSWPGRWDISSAGHLSAGDESLPAAIRELEEELGLIFPADEFEYLFTHLEMLDSVQKVGDFPTARVVALSLVDDSARRGACCWLVAILRQPCVIST